MTKLEDRIAVAAKKLQELKVQKQRQDAKKRSIELRTERSKALRKKILVGGIVLEKVKAGEIAEADFRRWLDQGLSHAQDRELFGLKSG
jgi:hypothetical protein